MADRVEAVGGTFAAPIGAGPGDHDRGADCPWVADDDDEGTAMGLGPLGLHDRPARGRAHARGPERSLSGRPRLRRPRHRDDGGLRLDRSPRRLQAPGSPIGWLLLATGLGFLLSVTTSDYAIYALYTDPGALPFASFAVWLQTWIFLVPVGAVVLLVALFPTGAAASYRWRWLPPAIVASFALAIRASMLRAGPSTWTTRPAWSTR